MPHLKTLKFFLVDDDVFCLNLYQQFLGKLGYSEIDCFNGGKDCIDNLLKHPDIIFLDYSMDEMNGIDVLQAIKRFDETITVIFISGQENVEVAVAALKYGAYDYIVKSKITPALLQITIDRLISDKGIAEKPTKKSIFGKVGAAFGI
jgi:DNA-binding NtrC family response regulator